MLLGLLTAELALRESQFVRTRYDPVFGWIYQPDSDAYNTDEGWGRSRWTQHGIRRAPTLPASGPQPILVLGDSFTEALQVDDREVFTDLAERRLRADGIDVSVLNAGRRPRSPADYIYLAELYLRTFRPSWTIVQITDDDFQGDSWKLKKTHFVIEPSGQLKIVPIYTRRPSGRFAGRLFHFVTNHVALAGAAITQVAEYREGAAEEPPIFRAGSARRSQPPLPADREPLAAEIASLRSVFHGRLTLLYLSAFDPAHPNEMTRTEAEVTRAAAALGVDVVSTRPEYLAVAREGRSPYGFPNSAFNEGHMNAIGHRLAADAVVREVFSLHRHGLL